MISTEDSNSPDGHHTESAGQIKAVESTRSENTSASRTRKRRKAVEENNGEGESRPVNPEVTGAPVAGETCPTNNGPLNGKTGIDTGESKQERLLSAEFKKQIQEQIDGLKAEVRTLQSENIQLQVASKRIDEAFNQNPNSGNLHLAASMTATFSGQLIAVAAGALAVEATLLVFILDKHQPISWFFVFAFLGALSFMLSIYFGGRGIASSIKVVKTDQTKDHSWYNCQSISSCLGILFLFTMMCRIGPEKQDKVNDQIATLSKCVDVLKTSYESQKTVISQDRDKTDGRLSKVMSIIAGMETRIQPLESDLKQKSRQAKVKTGNR